MYGKLFRSRECCTGFIREELLISNCQLPISELNSSESEIGNWKWEFLSKRHEPNHCIVLERRS